jgi:hypothetical protein
VDAGRKSLLGRDLLKELAELFTFGSSQIRRLGFMAGQIAVPADFDRMGGQEIARLVRGRE